LRITPASCRHGPRWLVEYPQIVYTDVNGLLCKQ
jgi:hypothetical protein